MDPSEVLKQVLNKTNVQDDKLKKTLQQVFKEQKILQILAMDSQTSRKYRSDQGNFGRDLADYADEQAEWNDLTDEWIDDDDIGYVKVLITEEEFQEMEQSAIQEEEQEEDPRDDEAENPTETVVDTKDSNLEFDESPYDITVLPTSLEPALRLSTLASSISYVNRKAYAEPVPITIESDSNAEESIPSSRSYGSPAFSSLAGSPDEGLSAALWPREANQFAFSQEDVDTNEDSDEERDEAYHEMFAKTDDGSEADMEDEDEEDDDNHINESLVADFGAIFPMDNDVADDTAPSTSKSNELEVLQINVYREKCHTGFEPSKDFSAAKDSIIANRYQVVGGIGEAVFSVAYKCFDLVEQNYVCLKVIKNNKDYFDQGLDEIQVLRHLAKHGDVEKWHVLRLIDYFYYKEHLMIVTELLFENLYDYSKRLKDTRSYPLDHIKTIMKQCLTALLFVHSLSLIHCDLKPENICLLKNAPDSSIKLIDFGSSCFTWDYLSLYIQSRSYRAPEVLLGLAYDQKIDIWSLGCVAAELYRGRELFSNTSIQTLLARIIGIIGDIPQHMLDQGTDAPKYFTGTGVIYTREEEKINLLYPKQTSLVYRLNCPDGDFVEFISALLQLDPADRPTAKMALQHPWLSD